MRTGVTYFPNPGRLVRIVNHATLTGLYGIVVNSTHRCVIVRLNLTGEEVRVHPLHALETRTEADA